MIGLKYKQKHITAKRISMKKICNYLFRAALSLSLSLSLFALDAGLGLKNALDDGNTQEKKVENVYINISYTYS